MIPRCEFFGELRGVDHTLGFGSHFLRGVFLRKPLGQVSQHEPFMLNSEEAFQDMVLQNERPPRQVRIQGRLHEVHGGLPEGQEVPDAAAVSRSWALGAGTLTVDLLGDAMDGRQGGRLAYRVLHARLLPDKIARA